MLVLLLVRCFARRKDVRGGSGWDLLVLRGRTVVVIGWRASGTDLSSLYVLEGIHRGLAYGMVATEICCSFMATVLLSLVGRLLKKK